MAVAGGIPKRVLSWWPQTLCNTVSIWLWGTISHHCAGSHAGQEASAPLIWQRGPGQGDEGVGLCPIMSHRSTVWNPGEGKLHNLGSLGYYKKQLSWGNTRTKRSEKWVGFLQGKEREEKLRTTTTVCSIAVQQSMQKGPQGAWGQSRLNALSAKHIPSPQSFSPR